MKRSYTLLTWIGTVLGAPMLMLLYQLIFTGPKSISNVLGVLPWMLLFGLFFSLPALLIYAIFFEWGRRKIRSVVVMRFSLLLLSIALIAISFWVLGGSSALYLAATYATASVLATAVFWRRLAF